MIFSSELWKIYMKIISSFARIYYNTYVHKTVIDIIRNIQVFYDPRYR